MDRTERARGVWTGLLVLSLLLPGVFPTPSPAAAGDEEKLEALWEKGQKALAAGKLERALKSFSEALEVDPDRPRTWNFLGGVHFLREDYASALSHFKQAFLLDPGDAGACNNIATTYEHLKEYEKAKAYYLKAITTDWRYPVPYRNLGVLFAYQLERPELALRYWARFLELVPEGEEAEAVRREMATLQGEGGGGTPAAP